MRSSPPPLPLARGSDPAAITLSLPRFASAQLSRGARATDRTQPPARPPFAHEHPPAATGHGLAHHKDIGPDVRRKTQRGAKVSPPRFLPLGRTGGHSDRNAQGFGGLADRAVGPDKSVQRLDGVLRRSLGHPSPRPGASLGPPLPLPVIPSHHSRVRSDGPLRQWSCVHKDALLPHEAMPGPEQCSRCRNEDCAIRTGYTTKPRATLDEERAGCQSCFTSSGGTSITFCPHSSYTRSAGFTSPAARAA